MLSRREREFLENPASFSRLEARVYKHKIKRKLLKTLQDLELINNKIIDGAFSSKIVDNNWGKALLSRGSGVRVPPGPLLK